MPSLSGRPLSIRASTGRLVCHCPTPPVSGCRLDNPGSRFSGKGNVADVEQCFIGIEYIKRDVFIVSLSGFHHRHQNINCKEKAGSAGSRTIAEVVLDAACRYKCPIKNKIGRYVQAIMEFVILHELFLIDGQYCFLVIEFYQWHGEKKGGHGGGPPLGAALKNKMKFL